MADRSTHSRGSTANCILAAVIGIVLLPFLIIGVGLFEELVTGTRVSHTICKSLGIFEPLEDLVDAIAWLLGF